MHPSLLILAGSALPAPWGLFELLLCVTFTAHLLVMNVALGGTLLALLSPGQGRGVVGDLAKRLPTSVAITVNLGVPPLLFASVLYGQYLYTAAILTAVTWLSLFVVVMAAYALLYLLQSRATGSGAGNGSLPLALAALLLLAASVILVNVSTLSLRPESWKAYFEHPGGTIINWEDPTLLPRWLHFVVASLAVGGLFVALTNRKAAGRGDAAAKDRVRLGLAWFNRATLAQVVVGLWFLFALPEDVGLLFLGGEPFYTAALLIGVALAGASLVQGFKGAIGRATLFIVATVLVMVVVRELARRAFLAPYFLPEFLPVLPQYGPFVMFLGSFLVVSGIIAWVVVAYRRTAGRS
jgi:hypothetical protein